MWLANTAQQCWAASSTDPTWHGRPNPQRIWAGVAGALGVLLVCMPLFTWHKMGQLKRRPELRRNYEQLRGPYRPGFEWWEAVVQFNMVVLTAISVFGKLVGGQITLLGLMGVQLLKALQQATCHPHRKEDRDVARLQLLLFSGPLLVRLRWAVFGGSGRVG